VDKDIKPGQLYRHYKGGIYRALGVGRHTESEEILVSYHPWEPYDEGLWFRPLSMWFEEVKVDGQVMPRFQLIGDF
jgi:hypothetical protein